MIGFFWWRITEYDAAEFPNLRGKRIEVVSDKDKFSISSVISGRRISAEVVSPSCSCQSVFMLAERIKWLEKPPDPSAMQTHEPKTKVVPASIAGKLKSKEAIEFFCRFLARGPAVGASCRSFTVGFSEGNPE
jgi:hypothetical protein